MNPTPCPSCSTPVSPKATLCPKCGHPLQGSHAARWIIIVIVALFFGLIAAKCGIDLAELQP